jgi:glycosyltransferase involved in cell wall biosynthesis
MRIIWTANTLSPKVAESVGIRSTHAISWVESMGTKLKQNHQLAIAAPGMGKTLQKLEYEGITYYILPEDCLKTDYWKEILEDFQPEIIHAYGTEKRHNLMLIEKYSNKVPIVISLQGIITAYQKYYFAGLPLKDILLNYTIGNFLLRNGIICGRKNFRKQMKYEQRMLRGVRYVEGRSDWDRAVSLDINPDLKYYHCPRMIRSAFFDYTWTKERSEPHSILVHQAEYPIKGLHIMLDALAKVRKQYPDVKLYIAGENKTIRLTLRKKLGKSGYTQIIEKKLTRLGLWDCVEFTGRLNAEQMAAKLASVNVCVIPSSIENAPNALAEAMITGTPCIASYVGGNADMLEQGQCGWLYRYDEPELLADRICHVFSDHQDCEEKTRRAQATAKRRHDPATLVQKLQQIYMDIIQDFCETEVSR